MEDDGNYWTVQLEEQFNNIFNDEATNEHNGHIKKAVSTERNLMEGWSNELQEEWRQA